MTILRWKAQSLQFHRHLTGPESVASRQGILPLFAKLAFVIASCGGAVASMAKKRWLSGNSDMMTIARLQEIRNEINAAFDQRSEEHTSELQSLMRISYAVFCLKKKTNPGYTQTTQIN